VYIHTYQYPEKVHQSLHLITEEEKIFFFFSSSALFTSSDFKNTLGVQNFCRKKSRSIIID
tara:strand:- start:1336 stop:1518 length:183 start_codon:yes stop_codon:yes gene_type:complete